MQLTLIIERNHGSSYLGYVKEIKGIVVQGETPEKVIQELLLSLKVKYAYDNNTLNA